MPAPAAPSFLELVQRRERGKLKLYVGMAAGVGKTYRMLQEAHELRGRGVDVVVGYVELNDVVERELGVTVRETVPDWVVAEADQVVNLDLAAEDLRHRLRAGKIYRPEKVESALAHFFTDENLSTLRELALREVAGAVDRGREQGARRQHGAAPAPAPAPKTVDRVMVCLSSDPPLARVLLRKASRIAGRLNPDWSCVYVQTPPEAADRIDGAVQRRLVDNIQLAQSLGAEVVKLEGADVTAALAGFAAERGVTPAIVGQSRRSRRHRLRRGSVVDRLLEGRGGPDVLVVSLADAPEFRAAQSAPRGAAARGGAP